MIFVEYKDGMTHAEAYTEYLNRKKQKRIDEERNDILRRKEEVEKNKWRIKL